MRCKTTLSKVSTIFFLAHTERREHTGLKNLILNTLRWLDSRYRESLMFYDTLKFGYHVSLQHYPGSWKFKNFPPLRRNFSLYFCLLSFTEFYLNMFAFLFYRILRIFRIIFQNVIWLKKKKKNCARQISQDLYRNVFDLCAKSRYSCLCFKFLH